MVVGNTVVIKNHLGNKKGSLPLMAQPPPCSDDRTIQQWLEARGVPFSFLSYNMFSWHSKLYLWINCAINWYARWQSSMVVVQSTCIRDIKGQGGFHEITGLRNKRQSILLYQWKNNVRVSSNQFTKAHLKHNAFKGWGLAFLFLLLLAELSLATRGLLCVTSLIKGF